MARAASPTATRSTIRAVLGPTNTGKTYLAVERMLGHATGMIGFPLRLLARENYDRIVGRVGRNAVALITGEEKILPPNPRFIVCTVEAMPMERDVDFLAVDEIQLCADPERGHVFTDRLLHARGRYETMFLGSDTMTDLIRLLLPDATLERRPRLSTLSWAGERKLNRLKRRSAIVAFSVDAVYELAEAVRRQRGGTAVVLGALSPRTRNAQVDLYQAGEVDYLVATDAIGMGLNMDVDHVAFAQSRKFDGARRRPLTAPEIGQIAGRAGRHMNDGTFGVTNNIPGFDEETVRRVEEHEYPAVRQLAWRNRALDFASPKRLLASLNRPPPREELYRARDADDQTALFALTRDPEVLGRATTPERVRLLWDVCQVPDFRKVMPDHHAALLDRIFRLLCDGDGRLPDDWVADQIERLARMDGDIDTLTARLAHIRTWTYIAHRADWIENSAEWQARARKIEDDVSDTLHQRLTDRFVDRRAAVLVRNKGMDAGDLLSAVTAKGEVVVEGHVVGHMEGLRFAAHEAADRREERALSAAAHRALAEEAPRRVARMEADPDQAFGMTPSGEITWQGRAVARAARGDTPLAPRAVLTRNSLIDTTLADRARQRVQRFLDGFLRRRLPTLLGDPARDADQLDAAGRGLLFQLREGFGAAPRRTVAGNLEALGDDARAALNKAGLRIGVDWVYLRGLMDIRAVRARAILWAAWADAAVPPIPNSPAPSLPRGLAPDAAWPLLGYVPAGELALRLDRWEKLSARLRRHDRKSPLVADAGLMETVGLPDAAPELVPLLQHFGFKPDPDAEEGRRTFVTAKKGKPKHDATKNPAEKRAREKGTPSRRANPDSPFAVLKGLVTGK
jgi:ATP-dependent RNA helicase SUPV3L1/SUV3